MPSVKHIRPVAIRKLPADDRIDDIVDAVEALIVRDRTLAFGMTEVAKEIASSRPLIYVYFEGVPQIIDELCRRLLQALDARLRTAEQGDTPARRAAALNRSYLDYLIERGPALQYILRDNDRNGPLEKAKPLYKRMMRALATEARRLLQAEMREALVLVELLSAIPDSLARQIRDGQIDVATARETCDRLTYDLVADLEVVR